MSASIYVSSIGTPTSPGNVAQFPADANGNVAPIRTLGGPKHSQLVTASGIAQDPDGFFYVAAPVIKSVFVYSPDATGDVAPFAVLAGTNAALVNPEGIAILNGRLYVANGPFGPGAQGTPSVAVFALPLTAGANNVAPVAVIAGPATGLNSPFGLALDSAGNVYVADLNNTVTVYAPPKPSNYAAPDNAAPILTITAGLVGPEGLAIGGNTLFVTNDNNTIARFSLPDGTPGPVISGPTTTLSSPLGICVEPSGNLVVANGGNHVVVFAPDASGDAAPIATIAGSATTLDGPQFVLNV